MEDQLYTFCSYIQKTDTNTLLNKYALPWLPWNVWVEQRNKKQAELKQQNYKIDSLT